MKKLLLVTTTFFISLACFSQSELNFHDYYGRGINGENVDFSQYFGKKVMVVNTASFCAFTPQFEDLEILYSQYQQYGFEIIGFPCNDFDNQDPNSDSTINEFCTTTYGITFQMMSRIVAVLPDTAPVFRWLQEAELNGVADAPVSWNFNKYLIDEAGNWVAHHSSLVSPTATSITNWIMSPSVISSVNELDESDQNLIQLESSLSDPSAVRLKVLQASSESMEVSIYGIDGKRLDVVYSGKPTDNQIITFSTGQMPSGIYLIRAVSGNSQQTIRYARVR